MLKSLRELEKREKETTEKIEELKKFVERRTRPLLDELGEIQAHIVRDNYELDKIKQQKAGDAEETPPGPRSLRWVEGDVYTMLCMGVIVLNFGVMVLEMKSSEVVLEYWVLDQLFMIWYVVELTLKVALHQRRFLVGKLTSDRMFHWLDMIIVLSGVLDQWLMPVLRGVSKGGFALPFNPSALRLLRILRVTRMFRLCKALYLLTMMDLSWTDGRRFESFTTSVILINSVTMGLELDVEWQGFHWMNLVFLVIYTFEVIVKLKRHKSGFFFGPSAAWHVMDLFIVTGGIVEMLAMPAYDTMVYTITGKPPKYEVPSGILSLLRIFRLLRVLRLYRLLTSVRALKKLVLGIADAMQGTIWVIILTFLVLYIFAIVFTTLVGRGIVVDKVDHKEAVDTFGTVEMSLYMLFKLMNDDQSVVMFTDSVWVKVLFMLSMVVLNWVMLATLTSVVTDHMNSATARAEKAEEKLECEDRQRESETRLIAIFREMDTDNSGFIDNAEFKKMLESSLLRQELQEASGLSTRDLVELFDYLSHDAKEDPTKRVILYQDFVNKLKREGEPASERTVFRLEEEMRSSERRMEQRFENLMRLVQEPRGQVHQLAVKVPGPTIPRWELEAKELEHTEAEEDKRRRGEIEDDGIEVASASHDDSIQEETPKKPGTSVQSHVYEAVMAAKLRSRPGVPHRSSTVSGAEVGASGAPADSGRDRARTELSSV